MDGYQDALFADGTVPGERDGQRRWDVVAPHLPAAGTLLDVGSNLGYFAVRAAEERPALGVISLEIDPALADRQRAVLRSRELCNVVLLQAGMNRSVARSWADTCDFFDAVLLLSIVHWFDDPAAVVASLSAMAGRLICELPDTADEGACNPEARELWSDPVHWLEATTGRDVQIVGRMQRHTSSVDSWVLLVDGPVTRRPSVPYLGSTFDHPEGRDYRIEHDGSSTQICIRSEVSRYRPGVNLHNLMSLGALRYPEAARIEALVRYALRTRPDHPDPLAHNMLWSADGISFVDFEEVAGLTTTGDALRALRANLDRWVTGATAVDGVEVRRYSIGQRIRYSTALRPIVRRLPAPLKHAARLVVARMAAMLHR